MPEPVVSGHRINDPNSRALAVLRIGVGKFCFVAFLVGRSAQIWSIPAWRAQHNKQL